MSSYQTSDAPLQDVYPDGESRANDSPVIARFPDLNNHGIRKNVLNSIVNAAEKTRFPYSILPKKALWPIAAVLFLGVGWLIMYGSDSEPSNAGSWQHDPPAAAAPEAPRWNPSADRKITSTVIQETERRPESDIKPAVNEETAPETVQPQTPLVVGTPVPPVDLAANENENKNIDWMRLNNSEYYWTVRNRSLSEDATCRTAARPNIDANSVPRSAVDSQQGGENTAPHHAGKVRLDGVIETPTVRVY